MSLEASLMDEFGFVISALHAGQRLDRYLAVRFPFRSRTWWRRAIDDGLVRLSGRRSRPAVIVQAGGVCHVSSLVFQGVRRTLACHELSILYQDDDIIVVNKPAGLIVHPRGTLTRGSLNCLLKERFGGEIHLVHRLDRFTSGVMIIARSRTASVSLDEQFRAGRVKKTYLALVEGVTRWETTNLEVHIGPLRASVVRLQMGIVSPPAGKPSTTLFRVLGRGEEHTVLQAVPLTGRTHQIRVHAAHLGHPVVRDKLYGPAIDTDYFEQGVGNLTPWYPDWHGLHASQLTICHPCHRLDMTFHCPPDGPLADYMEEKCLVGSPRARDS